MTGIGGIEKLDYTSVVTPVPQHDEVLLKILYCGINHLDLLIRKGKRTGPKIFPHILGSEIVGELASGELVAVYPWTFCGECEQCKNGNEQICDFGGTIGRTQWGGYAQYICIPNMNIIKIPSGVKPEEASSVVLAGTTACHLVRRANIADRSSVLVSGATGGVGTLVVQLLKHKKCKVITATSHENKIPLLKKLGIDHVVSVEKMVEETKALFPTGVQYAIDIIGGDTWSKAVDTLGRNGTLVFCSTSREEMGKVNIGNAFAKQLTILGVYGGNRKDLTAALDLLKKGVFQPVIDSVCPLKDVQKAHDKMEKQQVFGKMLLGIVVSSFS